MTSRRAFLTGAAILTAGCTGAADRGGGGRPAGSTGDGTTTTGGGGPDGGSAGIKVATNGDPPTTDEVLHLGHEPSTLRSKARSGGPPKDGIPSIDAPEFESVESVGDRLADGDIVFGVVRDGEAKAYPQRILTHHEIVNDRIADDPVAVTYCPLTGTAMGFERGGTTFGVSGRLVNNNLIMYDRATEAWWPQIAATAVPGPWNDSPGNVSLREFRVIWTTWKRWRGANPGTRVLTEDTGYARNYNSDPYGSYNPRDGYYSNDSTLFPSLAESDRFPKKDLVIGARTADGATAFYKPALRRAGLLEGSIAGSAVVAVYAPTLDTAYVYEGTANEVTIDGGTVTVDGSEYGPDAVPRERVLAFDAMWFAWYGYYPDTGVHS